LEVHNGAAGNVKGSGEYSSLSLQSGIYMIKIRQKIIADL
jgi:hypothetical protein